MYRFTWKIDSRSRTKMHVYRVFAPLLNSKIMESNKSFSISGKNVAYHMSDRGSEGLPEYFDMRTRLYLCLNFGIEYTHTRAHAVSSSQDLCCSSFPLLPFYAIRGRCARISRTRAEKYSFYNKFQIGSLK